MKILGLTPARGGSKGLPNKNLLLVNGSPLIEHTLRVAQQCQRLADYIVSTDSEKIAQVARAAGVRVPFLRPGDLAQDHSTDYDVIVHALNWLRENENRTFDAVAYLRPTTPLRALADLESAIDCYKRSSLGIVRSVSAVPAKYHAYWSYNVRGEEARSFVDNVDPRSFPRRQELPPQYHLNGVVDIMNVDALLSNKSLMFEKFSAVVLPSERSLDIDTVEDLKQAEHILSQQSRGAK